MLVHPARYGASSPPTGSNHAMSAPTGGFPRYEIVLFSAVARSPQSHAEATAVPRSWHRMGVSSD